MSFRKNGIIYKASIEQLWIKVLCCFVLISFVTNVIGQTIPLASAMEPQAELLTPPVELSPASNSTAPILKAISIDPKDPFKIDFVVDSLAEQTLSQYDQEQASLLIKYFLSFLAIPENELWVNLSPYEKDRIIPSQFETTNAGRDMLMQDYCLKQLAASLTHPDTETGKEFWRNVFKRAKEQYGHSGLPLLSFSKVWVVPDTAVVYEEGHSALIVQSHLKVLLEKDYLSSKKHFSSMPIINIKTPDPDALSIQVTHDIILPIIEQEINKGKYFAPLRQMYHSLILAIWFKKRLKEHLISQVYVNQEKTDGIKLNEAQIKERIYAKYLKAFKKGAYNFIREDYDESLGQMVPRKYFSGGFSFADTAMKVNVQPIRGIAEKIHQLGARAYRLSVSLNPLGVSKKILMTAGMGALAVLTTASEPNSSFMKLESLPVEQRIVERQKIINDLKLQIQEIEDQIESHSNKVRFIEDNPHLFPAEFNRGINLDKSSFKVSASVKCFPVSRKWQAEYDGVIQGFDPTKTSYKPGEIVFYIEDTDLRKHFITAQHHLILKYINEKPSITNGLRVKKGENLFDYLDNQEVGINLDVPNTINNFNKISQLDVNGQPIKSLISVEYDQSPQRTNAQLSLLLELQNPISNSSDIQVDMVVQPGERLFPTLDSIRGRASSIGYVYENEESVLRATVNGPVKFIAKIGQRVKQGDVLAIELPELYFVEPNENLLVRAACDGIVAKNSENQSDQFSRFQELYRIRTGNVSIGSLENSIEPSNLFQTQGEGPIVIELVQNSHVLRIPAVINKKANAISRREVLHGYSTFEIVAHDPEGMLRPKLPVRIIIPQEQERKIVLETLASINKFVKEETLSGSAPPPDQSNIHPSNPYYSSNSTNAPRTLNSIVAPVRQNPMNSLIETYEYNRLQLVTNAPYDTRITILGGPVLVGDQLKWNGGIAGMFSQSLQAGIQTGNAINAASPFVISTLANFKDILMGKARKEKEIALQRVERAKYKRQSAIDHVVASARYLLIELDSTKRKIALIESLQEKLRKSKSLVNNPALTGASPGLADHELDLQILANQRQISQLEEQVREANIGLNFFVGQTNLSSLIDTQVDFKDTAFTYIEDSTTKRWMGELLGANSSNPDIQEAMAAIAETQKGLKKHQMEYLPNLSSPMVGALGVNEMGGANVGVSPDEKTLRTGELKPGINVNSGMSLDVWNTSRERQKKLGILGLNQALDNRDKRAVELKRELLGDVSRINELMNRVKLLSEALKVARENIKAMVERPDLYLLTKRFLDAQVEISKMEQSMVDIKAQILKLRVDLDRMGIKQDFFDGADQQPPDQFSTQSKKVSFTEKGFFGPPYAAGEINYRIDNDDKGSNAWAWILMHDDPLKEIGEILIKDENPIIRFTVLNRFLLEFQNDRQFSQMITDVIMHTPYADVVWEMMKFMSQRPDRDVRFFVHVIHQAANSHNPMVTQLGFKALGDFLTNNPDCLKTMTQVLMSQAGAGYHQLTAGAADKVLVSFLLQESPSSIASERLLQSDYWNTDDLAQIHQQLTEHSNAHSSSPEAQKVKQLMSLIHDQILRRTALANIEQTFNPAGFKYTNGEIHSDADTQTYLEIVSYALHNQKFLEQSPHWRDMQRFIYPDLWEKAVSQTQGLLLAGKNPTSKEPVLLPFETISRSAGGVNELIYFQILGFDAQINYVAQLRNVNELMRIFVAYPTMQASVMNNPLLATTQGRVGLLKAYLEAQDSEALTQRFIESHLPLDLLKKDLEAKMTAVENDVYRKALLKMYQKTGQEVYLNLRLMTYTLVELHQLDDPRGQATRDSQVLAVAMRIAVQTQKMINADRLILYAGQTLVKAPIIDELDKLELMLNQEIDPRKANAYLEQRIKNVRDSGARTALELIKKHRDELAKKILSHDQSFPKFRLYNKWVMAAFGTAILSFIINRIYYKHWVVRAKPSSVLKLTYNRLLGWPKKKRPDSAMLVFPETPDSLYRPAIPPLVNWRKLVLGWSPDNNQPIDTISNDLNTILNHAQEIIRLMPYSPDLVWSDKEGHLKNEDFQRTFAYLNLLALHTLDTLQEYLKDKNIEELQKRKLQRDVDTIQDIVRYGLRFLRVLHYRTNINKVMTRKFPDDDWKEQFPTKLLSPNFISRLLLLYGPIWWISQRDLNKELPVLLDEGNELMPGLYPHPPKIIKESQQRLKEVTSEGKTLLDPSQREVSIADRNGNYYGRMWALVATGLYLASLFSSFVKIPGITLPAPSLWSTLPIVLVYTFYWMRQIKMLIIDWNDEIKMLAGGLDTKLRQILSHGSLDARPVTHEQRKREIIEISKIEREEATKREVDPNNNPRLDMIVIVSQEPGKEQQLQQYISRHRGKLIRRDTPVGIETSFYKGSGNVYLDILRRTKVKWESSANRPWSEARVMFVFHGSGIPDDDLGEALLSQSIADGYRALSRSNPNIHQAGHILVFTKEAYFGDIPSFPNQGICLLAPQVPVTYLKSASFVDSGFVLEGNPQVHGILEKVDLDKERQRAAPPGRGSKIFQFMNDRFHLDNPDLRQASAAFHMALVAPDVVGVFTNIAEQIEAVQAWNNFPRHLGVDLLQPLIIMNNSGTEPLEDRIEAFVTKRSRLGDMVTEKGSPLTNGDLTAAQGRLREFYGLIKNLNPRVGIQAYVPHSNASLVYPLVEGQVNSKEIIALGSALRQDYSLLSKSDEDQQGGVDFSDTRMKIKFQQSGGNVSNLIDSSSPESKSFSLQSFRGFDFKILQFQPVINPPGLALNPSKKKQEALL